MDARPLGVAVAALALMVAAPADAAEEQQWVPTPLDVAIVREHNAARRDPARYATHLEKYKQQFDEHDPKLLRIPGTVALRTTEGPAAVEDAIAFLQQAEPRQALQQSIGMSRAAADHVADQRNATGHIGTHGSRPADRVSRYGTWTGTIGENIAYGRYGPTDARRVVLSLIIDDGTPGRGHRRNIFNPAFRFVGVACGPRTQSQTACVITYAAGYTERTE
jgi:uncharacterized protein YkwD